MKQKREGGKKKGMEPWGHNAKFISNCFHILRCSGIAVVLVFTCTYSRIVFRQGWVIKWNMNKWKEKKKNGDDDEAKELRPREWNPVLFAFTSCMRPFHTISLVHASSSRCKDDTTVYRSHILSPAKLPMSWCGLWQHKETMKHHLQQQKYPPHEFCSGETWVKWVNTQCVYVCVCMHLYHFVLLALDQHSTQYLSSSLHSCSRANPISHFVCICFLFQFSTLH